MWVFRRRRRTLASSWPIPGVRSRFWLQNLLVTQVWTEAFGTSFDVVSVTADIFGRQGKRLLLEVGHQNAGAKRSQ
jgi:hypothetical protein